MDLVAVRPEDETLLLDLLNTTPVMEGVQHDLLDEPKTAAAWLRDHGLTHIELADLISARNVLQAVVRGTQSPRALKPFLTAVALQPTMTADGVTWELAAGGVAPGAVRAVLAWDALRINSPGRLRPCANDECRLFLIDRSKPNTARWCSMAICGNRMKARRHYQRAKTTEPDQTGG
ncbi:CGNR zinc finger domain-containing protein [Mycolicibacterium wolinskyi]|uniref:CGNR zinc finger domain-containing protein n=1 Tax=Mycolicibacterium wolinskyi TaxID=59750 RepID=UPI00391788C4